MNWIKKYIYRPRIMPSCVQSCHSSTWGLIPSSYIGARGEKTFNRFEAKHHDRIIKRSFVYNRADGLSWVGTNDRMAGGRATASWKLAHSVRSIPEKPWLYLAVWFFSIFQSDSSGNSRYSDGPWSLVIKQEFCLAGCPSKIILEQWLNNKPYSSHWITAETWCEESLCQ